MAKKKTPYFDDFYTMVDLSCSAAEHLQSVLRDFNPKTLPEQCKALHAIEQEADSVKHRVMESLVKEFVTPIDREDIIQLINELDNVTDKIEDVLIRMYMYNIQKLQPAAMDFADVILLCCNTLKTAIKEFPNFRKSSVLKQNIIDVNSMEEKGDAIYMKAVRSLYEQGGDPLEISSWSELFERLEDCCDTCEHVADLLEIIVMKNT